MHATLTPLRRAQSRLPSTGAVVGSRVVDALSRAAWAQAVLRAVAAASNLSFAHTRIAVLGSGPLAAELAMRTSAMGARVVVVGDDPVALVELSQRGLTVGTSTADLGDVVIAFATGELTAPLTPRQFGTGGTLLLVDAAELDEPPAVTVPTEPSSGRPGIARALDTERDLFVLVAREIVDESTRRTREQLAARFAEALVTATAADPTAANAELQTRADRALALELLR